MTKDEALKLALEALEAAYARLVTKCEQNLVTYNGVDVDTLTLSQEAITAIKEALAQPEQEPVAWMFQHEETGRMMFVETQQLEWGFEKGNPRLKKIRPVYTTPQQRTWVGLTDEELSELSASGLALWELWKAIEAKLKEKNT